MRILGDVADRKIGRQMSVNQGPKRQRNRRELTQSARLRDGSEAGVAFERSP